MAKAIQCNTWDSSEHAKDVIKSLPKTDGAEIQYALEDKGP